MARSDLSEVARLARRYLEQVSEVDDADLWPGIDAEQAAGLRQALTPSQRTTPEPARQDSPPRSRDVEPDRVRDRAAEEPPPPRQSFQPPTRPSTPEPQQVVPEMTILELNPSEWEGLTLEQFGEKISPCKRCVLHEQAHNFVFGKGDPNADLMFIGEGPGEDEDRTGVPFVGRAGKLLDKMILAMELELDAVYIANVVKHRPPKNRNPREDEVAACIPFLEHQIALIKPKLICLLGRVSAQAILKTNESLGRMRGRWYEYQGAKVMVTYHPAALLRNPGWKKYAWDDLKKLRYDLDGTEL